MDALPLSPAQRELVAANLVRLPHVLRADYRGYVRRLGWDEAYQVGSYALCRAARSWAGKCPFRYYAAFWLRALLTAAVQELDRRSCRPTASPSSAGTRPPASPTCTSGSGSTPSSPPPGIPRRKSASGWASAAPASPACAGKRSTGSRAASRRSVPTDQESHVSDTAQYAVAAIGLGAWLVAVLTACCTGVRNRRALVNCRHILKAAQDERLAAANQVGEVFVVLNQPQHVNALAVMQLRRRLADLLAATLQRHTDAAVTFNTVCHRLDEHWQRLDRLKAACRMVMGEGFREEVWDAPMLDFKNAVWAALTELFSVVTRTYDAPPQAQGQAVAGAPAGEAFTPGAGANGYGLAAPGGVGPVGYPPPGWDGGVRPEVGGDHAGRVYPQGYAPPLLAGRDGNPAVR
jgi:hypothetical protein